LTVRVGGVADAGLEPGFTGGGVRPGRDHPLGGAGTGYRAVTVVFIRGPTNVGETLMNRVGASVRY
jgi:hypothetical protein